MRLNLLSHLSPVARLCRLLCVAGMALIMGTLSATANVGADYAEPVTGVVRDWQACRERISDPVSEWQPRLDASQLRVVNWNIQKLQSQDALPDLDRIARHSDLVLIQEAAFRDELIEHFPNMQHWSFAPGYRSRSELTGVMTLSASAPVMRCSFTHQEPWLGTPKATNITRYSLEGSAETLVVVNVHLINLSFGTAEFQEQLNQIAAVLAEHRGPVILSGDFNTWRDKRLAILGQIARDLGLEAVAFANDARRKTFGRALDHVYVRGLNPSYAVAHQVSSSDHNPMSVYLSF